MTVILIVWTRSHYLLGDVEKHCQLPLERRDVRGIRGSTRRGTSGISRGGEGGGGEALGRELQDLDGHLRGEWQTQLEIVYCETLWV